MKGCLVTNTANELNADSDPKIKSKLSIFTNDIRSLFLNNLKQELTLTEQERNDQADYFIISMFGLASASKLFNESQLQIFIKNIFKEK